MIDYAFKFIKQQGVKYRSVFDLFMNTSNLGQGRGTVALQYGFESASRPRFALDPPPAAGYCFILPCTVATKAFPLPRPTNLGRKKPSCCHSPRPSSPATGSEGRGSLSHGEAFLRRISPSANAKGHPIGCPCVGGEGEIRTLERLLTVTRFPIVRARPATRLLRKCSTF